VIGSTAETGSPRYSKSTHSTNIVVAVATETPLYQNNPIVQKDATTTLSDSDGPCLKEDFDIASDEDDDPWSIL